VDGLRVVDLQGGVFDLEAAREKVEVDVAARSTRLRTTFRTVARAAPGRDGRAEPPFV
jgi:hypothetical protein